MRCSRYSYQTGKLQKTVTCPMDLPTLELRLFGHRQNGKRSDLEIRSYSAYLCETWTGMDQSFASCLAEIEKSYLVLPKAARIRVERWVQKLVSTGNNPTWKKHRNEYARLLLSMIVARNLEAPFNAMPSEEPLAPFSSQFKAINKNNIGPHESSFWRELYQQLGDHRNDLLNEEKDNSTFPAYKKDRISESILSHAHTPKFASSGTNQVVLSREIQSLNLLIREQTQRIKLLEQQLHDERTQHELQLQRLHYSNRVEVNNLKKQIEDFAVELSVQELSPSRRAVSRYLDENLHSDYLPSNGGAGASFNSHAVRLGPSFDAHQTHPRSPGNSYQAASSPLRSFVPDSTSKRGNLSFLEQKNNISAMLNGVSVMEPDSMDLTPQPKAAARPLSQPYAQSFPHSFAPPPGGASSPTRANTTGVSGVGVDESHFGSPGLDASLHWAGPGQHLSTVGDQEDEAFLTHIDRFQSEIKKINTNITLTSPERF